MAVEQKSFQHYALKGDKFKYIPVDKQDMMMGQSQCNRCEEYKRVFFYKFFPHERIHYSVCADCVLELNPPKLELMLATNSKIENHIYPTGDCDLWDSTHSRQERSMNIKEFIKCGWFVRKVKEERPQVPKRTILTINLEYHGNLICGRFMNHYEKLGLDNMTRCKSPFCDFLYTNHYKDFYQMM